MIQIDVSEVDYFLPEDGQIALARFLELLKNPGETWICAFGFTLQGMFDEIKAAMARGIKFHILLDHSQEGGRAEAPKVQDLVNNLNPGSSVVITTAGLDSAKPSQIWHDKCMVVASMVAGQPAACWEGSTNFSISAWFQGNTARVFQNQKWADIMIAQQQAHAAWALQHEPQFQLKPGGAVVAAPTPIKKLKVPAKKRVPAKVK